MRPESTAERFIPDPFVRRSTDLVGMRLYRTGDQVRWRADGNLEFLGRIDQQIKIRGYRIELGEIESVLREHSRVQQAVVIVQEDSLGEKRLIAYVVPRCDDGQARCSGEEYESYLKRRLPGYMVPRQYVEIESVPLTANGKIDRKRLPRQELQDTRKKYVQPRNAVEETLCKVWAEVLEQEQIGIHDNFFEIGGHSLLAGRVIVRIRRQFQIDLPLRSIFEAPSISLLASVVEVAARKQIQPKHAPIRRVDRNSYILN